MNQDVCFAVEELSARRTSTRARGMPILPAKCFKKVYRKKEDQQLAAPRPTIENDHCPIILSPREESFKQLARCASLIYTPVGSDSIQAKAIMNYRVKKLKKTLRTQAEILKAMKEKRLPAKIGLSSILKATKPNSRSDFALRRDRDCHGRFVNPHMDHTKSVSQVETDVDSRDNSLAVGLTRPNLMSGCFDDFFTYQSSERGESVSVDTTPLNSCLPESFTESRSFQQLENRRTLFTQSTKQAAGSESMLGEETSLGATSYPSQMMYEDSDYQHYYPLSAHENNLLSCLQSFDDFEFADLDLDAAYEEELDFPVNLHRAI